MILNTLLWWLLISVIGWISLPLTLRLLRFLPDGGVGLSRVLGITGATYVFWLLVSLGALQNSRAAIAGMLVAVAIASLVVSLRHRAELADTWRRARSAFWYYELLFAISFLAFALFRAWSPEIVATEKPMEFGFINAILRSSSFPPNDPWLAGYSISYYYFGYLPIAMLAKLGSIPSEQAFNLAQASTWALAATGSAAVVHNLILLWRQPRFDERGDVASARERLSSLLGATLAPVLVLLAGNLEGVFELIRARGWGSDALWKWLDIRNLATTDPSRLWYPDDGWWWWRASRLLHDRDLAGNSQEVISEFPIFSFLLGDNHPHVLALPLVLLMVALALNLLLGALEGRRQDQARTSRLWVGGRLEWVVIGLLLGVLIFANTWDYPIYFVLAVGAWLAGAYWGSQARFGAWLWGAVVAGGSLAAIAVLGYLPFLLSFRSQAGGIALVRVSTQLHQFLIMFGVFIAAIAAWLVLAWRQAGILRARKRLSWIIALAAAALAVALVILGKGTAGVLVLLIGVIVILLADQLASSDVPTPAAAARAMLLWLVFLGLGLALAVELIYLRDVFNSRMNTVFKFYYQAWVLLGLAAAAAIWRIAAYWREARSIGKAASGVMLGLVAILLAGALVYPLMAIPSRANGFNGTPTLDGMAFIRERNLAEYEAILWLRANAPHDAVLLEAPGGQYSEANRLSAYSGVPTLLGWGGHEMQWRGSYEIPGAREPDIETIYTTSDQLQARSLLVKYGVTYLVLGPHERSAYSMSPAAEAKFAHFMSIVYTNGDLTIYGWPR